MQFGKCTITNTRGQELEDLANDKGFLFLNYGTHTYRTLSYNTIDALDLTLISPDIFPYISWRVLDHIGSDQSPILSEIDFKIRTLRSSNLSWNFDKANWNTFKYILTERLSHNPLTDDLEGKCKKRVKKFANCPHNSEAVQKLLADRDQLLRNYAQRTDDKTRIKIIKINADIRRSYIDITRIRWEQLCSKLDYKTSNSRLWKLAKSLDRMQPQEENLNSITKSNASPTIDGQEAAEELGKFYSKESRPDFQQRG
ncbi:hypothetical protein AVEN_275008-1 [Araneus ventricosus]|uniref:Uncharacterized protein n=1 Tax=Araneus ventricosus TaxID=182803 RepID=A0A4Y2R9W0_ARAVE|nr:hypothetical protein AVEN_275008-1 [Araneus ventricosus]